MKTTVLKEANEYTNGVRVNVQTIRTETTLADDIAKLANYMNAYAAHMGTLERLRGDMPQDEVKQRPYIDEINRIECEIDTLKAAIQVQEELIGGHEDAKK